jgi:hypothetical protein
VLTFFILGVTVNWCHYFTKLTSAGGKCTIGSLSKLFTLFYTFLSTLLLILYPSQVASNDPANNFVNNLFNSSRGGSTSDDPWYNSRGGSTGDDPWYYEVSMFACVHFGLVCAYELVILSTDLMLYMHVINIVKFE